MPVEWTPHPVFPVPSPEQLKAMPLEAVETVWREREKAIRLEQEDPYRYGVELGHWEETGEYLASYDELLILGGNRSGKTEWAAKAVIRACVENPNTLIWAISQNSDISIEVQQRAVYKYIPAEWKMLGKEKNGKGNVSFSWKTGFTKNRVVFPNGSEIVFRHYSQYEKDPTSFESGKVGAPPLQKLNYPNVGIWGDELIPYELLQTLRKRLATNNAKIIITFTPIQGYNDTVKHYLTGAKTIKKRYAELVDREVEVLQKPLRSTAIILYFWTQDNPYGGYDRLARDLKFEKQDEILCRAYGIPTRQISNRFPKFNPNVNVIAHADLPFVKDKGYPVTHYQVIDPGQNKPWVVLWIAVDAAGTWWVYEEFPDVSYGEWADMSRGVRGMPGEAARPNGFGIDDYVETFRAIEGDIEVFERLIDPRMGAAITSAKEGTTNIIQELEEAGLSIIPAPGLEIEHGLQVIDNLLSYDTDKPVSAMNHPRIYISDKCQNLIYCMSEYTGRLGKDEPTKDFIDCLRYTAVHGIEFVDPEALQAVSVSTW